MTEADTPISTEPLESPAAVQLRRGFPWLRFRQPLEAEFREAYREQAQRRIRVGLWLALAVVVGFVLMDHFVLGRQDDRPVDMVRFLLLLPTVIGILVLTHSSLYRRAYEPLAQVLAPVFGVGVVAAELLALPLGVSFFPALMLAIVGIALLTGLLFYAALRSVLIIVLTYAIGAMMSGMPSTQAFYNSMVLLFTAAIASTVCYTLERANRTNYLEARLLTEMASRDGLTGIYNRRMLDDHIDKVWQQAGRERAAMALLLIDIDYFKAYNDYFGHQAGDECLKQVARTLARCGRRPLDFTARYGGEEFAIVLYNARRDYVEELTRRIQATLEGLAIKHPSSPVAKSLTVSIGAACVVPQPERSHFGLVQLADEALYEAKGGGRNRVVIMDKEYEELSTGSFRNRPTAVAG